jgi:hypothetical protein
MLPVIEAPVIEAQEGIYTMLIYIHSYNLDQRIPLGFFFWKLIGLLKITVNRDFANTEQLLMDHELIQ